jgi:hypothetical protein
MALKIKSQGFSIANFKKLVEKKQKDIEVELQTIAEKATDKMRSYVKTKRSGSTGKLKDALTVEVIKSKGQIFFGIGNINRLNQNAPYWFVANYGRVSRGGNKGAAQGQVGRLFVPFNGKARFGFFGTGAKARQGVNNQRFHFKETGDKKAFFMTPTKPVRPINYIQKTKTWLNSYWKTYINKLKSKK